MADDIQKCLEIYQEQLYNGYIRVAYATLTKYVAELKSKFPQSVYDEQCCIWVSRLYIFLFH